jgi:hypothetical protein
VIELPVAIRAKSDKVVEGVHNRDRRFEWEGCHCPLVTDFDVLVVPTLLALMRERREVLTAGVLPQASVPASRMVGAIGNGTDRL